MGSEYKKEMITERSATQDGDLLMAAKEQIQTAPIPGWVDDCPFRFDFPAQPGGAVTHLLFEQQVHAELRQTFCHAAVRLETMQGVEQHSPWRLDFDSSRHITLHWIKTRRRDEVLDQPLSSARVLEMPGLAPQEWRTLWLMLEDVRPGDILEWCYTVESHSPLLPERCAAMFSLPAGTAFGKFYFSVLFNPARPMQWKASEPDWEPVKQRNNGTVLWNLDAGQLSRRRAGGERARLARAASLDPNLRLRGLGRGGVGLRPGLGRDQGGGDRG